MKGALIKKVHYDMSATNKESYDQYEVNLVVDITDKKSLEDFRRNMDYDYAVVVNDDVRVFNLYDPQTGIFTDTAGNRIYPPLTYDETVFKLAREVAELNFTVNTNELTLDELKDYMIRKNKNNLERYLFNNPMVYKNKTYTVTSDKQNQLTGVLQAYNYAKAIGIDIPLTWNETGEECTSYTFEELVTLYLKILEYVKPIVTYQQHNEIRIREAKTVDEVLAIDIDFAFYDQNANIQYDNKNDEEESVEIAGGPNVTE